MDSYVNIGINLIDKENIGFMVTEKAKKDDYIDALIGFIMKKKAFVDESLSRYKGNAPKKWLSRLNANLLACEIFVVYDIFLHVDNVGFELKKFYADCFIDKLKTVFDRYDGEILGFFGERDIFPDTVMELFKFYSESFSANLMYDYSCMIKRFGYLMEYDYIEKFIEYPTEEDIAFLDRFRFGWSPVLVEHSADNLVNLLNDIIVCVEEFMSCPFDLSGQSCAEDEYEQIGNMFKWQKIGSEVAVAVRNGFEKVMVYNNYDLSFETDWDTFDSLTKNLTKGMEKSLKVAEKYNLWVSRHDLKGYASCFSFYDSYGDLYLFLTIKPEVRPFMLFSPFEKKNRRFIVNVIVTVANRPDLYAYEKLDFAFSKENNKLIRDKIEDFR